MIVLNLYGALKEEFGTGFELDAGSPIEAVRILEANFPGRFLKAFAEGSFFVVRGSDLEGGRCDTEHTLDFITGEDVHIVPEVEGAGGFFKAIVGAVIIVAAVVAAVYTGGSSLGVAAAMSQTAFMGVSYSTIAMFGASMMFGGIAEMLTPTPKIDGATAGAAVDQKASYIFNGAENIVAQGVPVPIIYGEIETGSVLIGLSLTVEDVNAAVATVSDNPQSAIIEALSGILHK